MGQRFSAPDTLYNAPVHYVYWHDVVFSRTLAQKIKPATHRQKKTHAIKCK